MKKWKVIFNFWKKYKYKIIVIQFLEILGIVVVSSIPYINTQIYDVGIGQQNVRVFFKFLLLYFFLGVFHIYISYVLSMFKVKHRFQYIKDLKVILLEHFLSNKFNQSSADINTVLSVDVANFVSVFSEQLISLLYSGIKIIIFCVIIILMNWKMAVISIACVVIVLMYNYKMGSVRTCFGNKNHDLYVRQIRSFNEIIRYIREIRGIGASDYARGIFEENIDTVNDSLIKTQKVNYIISMFGEVIRSVMECILLGVGGVLIVKDNFTIGMLIAFIGYSARVDGEISSIIDTYAEYKLNKKSIDIIIYELENIMNDEELVKISKSEVKTIDLQDVCFKFVDSDDYLLTHVNMMLDNKHINYLFGKSGSGKSTIAKLIMNEISNYQGNILFDGISYKEKHNYSIDEIISWVPQEPIFFSDTIYNNLTLGKNYDMDTIIHCCKICQVDEEIMALHDGFDTIIGDVGVNLSGGQKQRIAIARALLQNRPIIIFDEITSSISRDSMYKIKNGLIEIAKNGLILIITHEPDFVVENSNVFLLDNKKIEKQI